MPSSNVTLDKFILQDVLFRFLILLMQPILGTQLSNDGRLDERRASPSEPPGKSFPTVRAVAILEAMATARRPLGVSELGALLGLPKPTAHRIVRMLETEGLLQREPGSRRFVPGARHEPAAPRFPLQQAFRFKHSHDPVRGRLGQTQQRAEFGNAERASSRRHCFENCDSPDGGK